MTTSPDPPAAPNFTNVTPTSFTVNWNAPYNGGSAVDNYEVDWSTDLNNLYGQNHRFQTPSYGRSMTITGLTPNTGYFCSVKAHNATNSWGSYSNPSKQDTPVALPDYPQVYGADQITQYSFRYNHANNFYNGNDSNGGSMQVSYGTNTDPNLNPMIGSNGQVVITGLQRNTQYFAWVRSHNSAGYSGWSNRTDVRTLPYPPGPPRWISLDNVSQTSVHLRYQGPSDDGGEAVQQYQIGYGEDSSMPQKFTDAGWGDVVLNGLKEHTQYYIWLNCRNSQGYGDYSNQLNFLTRAGALMNVQGSWKWCITHGRINGKWVHAQPWVKVNGTWTKTG